MNIFEVNLSASPVGGKKEIHVPSLPRNFLLFKTDLFVFRQRDEDIDNWCVGGDCAGWFYVRLLLVEHIRQDLDPVMEDWGWTFAVSVDGVRVSVNAWAYVGIENCWLFGLESDGGWFRRQPRERLMVAKSIVADALETMMAADSRIEKHAWFADNPFESNVEGF
ncbi:MAG: hypothetical protein WD066_17010 [Planctomycetaceae bacterium]